MKPGPKPATPVNKNVHKVCPNIKGAKRERILARLANGDSAIQIATENGHDQRTVARIRDSQSDQDQQSITEIKQELAIQAREIAKRAGTRIVERLEADTMPSNLLPSTYGISVDKYLALSNAAPAQALVNVNILNQ